MAVRKPQRRRVQGRRHVQRLLPEACCAGGRREQLEALPQSHAAADAGKRAQRHGHRPQLVLRNLACVTGLVVLDGIAFASLVGYELFLKRTC